MTATSQDSHLDIDALLAPIPADQPQGAWLRYEGTYDAIEESRRDDDPSAPRDIWIRPLKVADWAEVERLCTEALATRSKDFQIAAWLLEARARQWGLVGVRDGLELLLGLAERWWDDAFPPLDPEDPEWRASPFHWLNEKFAERMAFMPVAPPVAGLPAGPVWADVVRARSALPVPDREESEGDGEVTGAGPRWTREALKDFVESISETDRQAYAQLLDDTIQLCARLELQLDERMGPDAPSLARVRQTLSDIRTWWTPFVPPPEPNDAAGTGNAASADNAGSGEDSDASEELTAERHESFGEGQVSADAAPTPGPPPPSDRGAVIMNQGPITSRADAYRRLLEIADYLQTTEPHSPTPYLIRRAASWGHMTLRELLYEFAQDGLDLRALFTFLGLDEDEYQREQEEDYGRDHDEY